MENVSKAFDSIKTIIGSIIVIVLVVGIAIGLINAINSSNQDDGLISVTEAQKKCVTMEMIDLWRYNGVRDNVVEKAEETCRLLWNTPEKEKEFRKYIEEDWQNRKDEVYDGKTYEEFYNENKDYL